LQSFKAYFPELKKAIPSFIKLLMSLLVISVLSYSAILIMFSISVMQLEISPTLSLTSIFILDEAPQSDNNF